MAGHDRKDGDVLVASLALFSIPRRYKIK